MSRWRAIYLTPIVVGILLMSSGCAHMPSRHSFGIRPDVSPSEPPPAAVFEKCGRRHGGTPAPPAGAPAPPAGTPTPPADAPAPPAGAPPAYVACLEYGSVQQWSADLEESFFARASQNRWWIYVAGALGLATVAASGGLAAAGAVGLGTIALLNVSGGFATGFFAVLNNSDLAAMYTLAANDIATARSEAERQVEAMLSTQTGVVATYYTQASVLRTAVTNARRKLEDARTTSAVTALARAQKEKDDLQAEINKQKAARAARVYVKGEVKAISDAKMNPLPAIGGGTSQVAVLTVDNVNLDGISKDDLTVVIGGRKIPVDAVGLPDVTKPTSWRLSFTPPASQPKPGEKEYAPVVLIDDQELATAPTARLKYQ